MPLANEFQEKLNKQSQEMQAAAQPQRQGPREHREDTMIVCNILVNTAYDVNEVIPYATARHDPRHPAAGTDMDFGQVDNHLYEHSWNTKDFFEVRFDGRPHRLKPGQKRYMPRYLADHFAKHLIDFILIKREEKEKLTGLVKNIVERRKLYNKIIVGVANYYEGDAFGDETEGLRIEREVDALNQRPVGKAFDVGEVPNQALGYGTTDKPPEKVEDDIEEDALSDPIETTGATAAPQRHPITAEELAGKRKLSSLQSEARKLGIEVTEDMTKLQLATAIVNF